MPKKVRSKADLIQLKNIIRSMWTFEGYSVRKIAKEFNSNDEYVRKYKKVSISSVQVWVVEIRKELENWVDEDALEKYTGEFVRQQHIIDTQIENLRDVQKLIDITDSKERELFLRFEESIHRMTMDKTKMMSEIELVLRIKKLNKDRRLKEETLVLVDENGLRIDKKAQLLKERGYVIPSLKEELDIENGVISDNETESDENDSEEGDNINDQE